MTYDFLIVGAGLAGAVTAERIANVLGRKVLVVDKRFHIAGNCHDYYDETGSLVHRYGPHIFHTNSGRVWQYLSQFTSWTQYYHRVLGVIDGKKVPVPFNFNSLYALFPGDYAARIEKLLLEQYSYGQKIPILRLRETNHPELKFLADYIYKFVFEGYTRKQWGLSPDELDESVTSRIPVSLGRDDRYFRDKYQGIPSAGYTKMVENILCQNGIHIMLNTDFEDIKDDIKYNHLIYTGPIDEYFGFCHGKLPYRSLRFKFESHPIKRWQEAAQVNYPNEHDYTRITEFNHFLGKMNDSTTIAFEFPEEYERGRNEPYYPVPMKETCEIYAKYASLAARQGRDVTFLGRLGCYRYFNMDQIVGLALDNFDKMASGIR